MVNPEIRLIHLQLTKNCNLRCPFCGQWGDNGYMKGLTSSDLPTEEWLRVVAQAVRYREETGIAPQFILWGGEPLVSPSFSAVAEALHQAGFTTALITNGALLGSNASVINRTIDTLYISLDGSPEIHNRTRRSSRLFEKIERGLAQIDSAKLMSVALFTLCADNYQAATDFPHVASRLGFERVIFQNLIYCTQAQSSTYRHWLKNSFDQDAPHLGPWISDEAEPWTAHLSEVAKILQANLDAGNYPIEVKLYPGEINAGNIAQWFDSSIHLKKDRSACLMPFRHLQINHDGNVHFCVDFNDFTLGNIRDSSITDLFHNERARRFRAEGPTCNSLCARCPWYYNESLNIDQNKVSS